MKYLAILLVLFAGSAQAQLAARDTDQLLSKMEMSELLIGKKLEYFTGGFATYDENGLHTYRYEADGEPIRGQFTFNDDSSICVEFENGFSRCDLLVNDGSRYVTIIENGERYPIRAISEAK